MLATSLLTSYGYLSEQFVSRLSGDVYEKHVYLYRLLDFNKYAWVVWILFFCNTIAPQILWVRRLRRSETVLFIVSVLVLIGMWLERFMIITSSLSEDFLPSSWGIFKPTIWDILTYVGSLGLFAVLFMLFVRFLPVLSMAETKARLPDAHGPGVGR